MQDNCQLTDSIIITPFPSVESWEHVKFLLDTIFDDSEFIEIVFQRLKSAVNNDINSISDFEKLTEILKESFRNSLHWEKNLEPATVNRLKQLADYIRQYIAETDRYNPKTKSNPTAIFWPDPQHKNFPSLIENVFPYANKFPLMDSKTPIGSAGSCFAIELAKIFQERGYNYVVTEGKNDPSSTGVFDGGCTLSANYGIFFNSPSFLQLVQKAFDVRKFKRILFWDEKDGYYLDPYREGIVFRSIEEYFNDYDKHVNAVREVFLTSEVFVITLGLNECWQFISDGSFMSRNPRNCIFPFVKHRVLSIQENVDNIQQMFDLVKIHNPNFKLIVTLSPVPFLATGRAASSHVIEANCHSKATLRLAAEELVSRNKEMYYFPSYEYVTSCAKNPWEADNRHVRIETVREVARMFEEMFFKSN